MASSRYARPRPSGSNFELYAWLFMRVSGLLLIFLALGHLALMHLIHSVEEVDFDFVAGRLTGPWGLVWRTYDLLLLGLALLHGLNGLRVVLDDYVHHPGWRAFSMSALYVLGFIFLALGALVMFAFQPPVAAS
ncbi:MAG TPA: hypothetical protein VIL11_05975 [Limnochordales bacterium]